MQNCFNALVKGKEKVLTSTLKLEKGTFLPDMHEENNTREIQYKCKSTTTSTVQ